MRAAGIACLAVLLGVCSTAGADVIGFNRGGTMEVAIVSFDKENITVATANGTANLTRKEVLFCFFGSAEELRKWKAGEAVKPDRASKPTAARKLTEQRKRQIYGELESAWKRATQEAKDTHPDDPTQSLKVGQTFRLSKQTPLVPEIKPADPLAAMKRTRQLSPGAVIKIMKIERPHGYGAWYYVEARDSTVFVEAKTGRGNLIGRGWVNSLALMGQAKTNLDEQVLRQHRLKTRLNEKYEKALARKHGLSLEQLSEINTEAVENGWYKEAEYIREKPLPSSSRAEIKDHHTIAEGHWPGCTDRKYLDKLLGLVAEGDVEAFQKAYIAGRVAGICTMFETGEVVYLRDVGLFSGVVRVRRKGETREYWTNIEAVK